MIFISSSYLWHLSGPSGSLVEEVIVLVPDELEKSIPPSVAWYFQIKSC